MAERNHDAAARAARERAELAAVTRDPAKALEACAMLSELFAAGYRVVELAPDEVTEVRPVLLSARHAGRCQSCGGLVREGDFIWWTRSLQGVDCDPCGKRKGFKVAA